MAKNNSQVPLNHSELLARLQNEELAKRRYHAAKERTRRQRIDTHFQQLKLLIPKGMRLTDKNGILKSATTYIAKVQGLLIELRKRDPELALIIDDLVPTNRSDLDFGYSDENGQQRSSDHGGNQSDESSRNPAFCLKNLLN